MPAAKNCPICESPNLKKGIDLYYWRENLLHFSDCGGCNLTFANPMPSDELISQGNSALVRLYHQGKSFEQDFREARQSYLRGKVMALKLKSWKKRGRFLELGCYQGFFSLGVQDHCDWEVETLEIAPTLANFVENSLKLKCHKGTLETVDLPEQSYDFILCHDLIEHINQPKKFLKRLSALLRPSGRLQIITPNTLQDFAFNRRAFEAGTPPTILLNHIMNFSPKSLRLALENQGLTIKKMYCYEILHSLKDFGFFGLGKPGKISKGPSMFETLKLSEMSLLDQWTPEKIATLRAHPKVSWGYAFWKELLPNLFQAKVPASLGIGHEIYALAEKTN